MIFPIIMEQKFRVYSGDTFRGAVAFYDQNDTDYGLEEFENITVAWHPRRDNERLIFGEVTIENNVLEIMFTSQQTRDMAGHGIFDVQSTRDGDVTTIIRGTTEWMDDVTPDPDERNH